MSLRARVALVTALTTLAVVALAGGALVALVARDQRDQLDENLVEQAEAAGQQAVRESLGAGIGTPRQGRVVPDLNLVARIVTDGEVTRSFGDFPLDDDDHPPPGYSNRSIDGERWRILSISAPEVFPQLREDAPRLDRAVESTVIEVAIPTAEMNARVVGIGSQVLRVGVVAVALAGLLGWFLGGAALRPLARLRRDAEKVSGTEDQELRVADQQGLREVDDLGRSLNMMLDRIRRATAETEAALEASRTFAGNAAHELRTPLTSMQANLDVLERNPSLDPSQRAEIIRDIQEQQRRLLRLLATLRLLARGDLHTAPPTGAVDLAELVDVSVSRARVRHPEASFALRVEGGPFAMGGWEEGLQVMVDNLLDNAALHGSTGTEPAAVSVLLRRDDDGIELAVEDHGPGIPPDEREHVLERFGRGRGATATGSGLGLALVVQQATLHGGGVEIRDSPLGGARLLVHLPPDQAPGP